ncbi:hypothetical protein CBER1_04036 [Cercospora berteroae]|uniref:Protein kinase domain-containing protein n=1 Tax=Cercospora berteroae TaxID=357750 RepID=A0A2S6C4X2_9PEZI|nr:hypothetical protein CBER1_04036 [Cercospora berteroae]
MSAAVQQQNERFASPSAQLATSPPSSSRRAAGQSNHASIPSSPPHSQMSPSMPSPRGNQMQQGAMSASTYQQYYPDQVTSPSTARPSSQQTPTHASRAQSSHGQPGVSSGSDSERRRGTRPSQEQSASGKSQRSRNAPTSSRSQTSMGQPPMGTDLPRENSAVINRIVVDDPQTDRAREEARKAEARPNDPAAQMAALSLDTAEPPPVQRSRQEHLKHSSSNRKEVKFGDYILGQTIGEGEFGKVKMGWKKDSTVQVAIKLIRKESLAGNNTRLPKIYREISILRELQHPNIVRLHEFVETERHMGIILEYASGGELFDYILNHRYLKDPAARRLFAQLVSGVGYLHKKGIVHRDLKLENLLLDRNKHIIITDFGFANTFDPNDELGDDVEGRIADKDYVKRYGYDKVIPWQDGREGGHRRGDLMQTSCGSPCYAAPELVYAMLAGYLPFDDDPANPEGDNINLLYKYIVSTPLTFPEYVTPHARDLLRRILVPDPRRRADLFEVARHSWLSEYTHVVGFIGSRVKSDKDIVDNALPDDEAAQLGRSASVREPSSRPAADRASTSQAPRHVAAASMGGDEASDFRKQQRDAKRRTVQVEYVAPQAPTARPDASPEAGRQRPLPITAVSGSGKTRARTDAQGPVEVTPQRPDHTMQPPSRSGRVTSADQAGSYSASSSAIPRPNTSGTIGGTSRLPSRGNSYSTPAAAQPTNTNAQGSFSQPKSSSGYIISGSGPMASEPDEIDARNRPQSERSPTGGQFQTPQQPYPGGKPSGQTGHRRSSTLGSLADKVLNRGSSKRQSQSSQQDSHAVVHNEKRDRKYPPVSMRNAIPNAGGEITPRPSTDSRRPSFSLRNKASKDGSVTGRRSSRRFSWLPASFSMNNFGGKKADGYESGGDDGYRPPTSQQSNPSKRGRPESKGTAFGRVATDSPQATDSEMALYLDDEREKVRERRGSNVAAASQYNKALPVSPGNLPTSGPGSRKQYRDDGYGGNLLEGEAPERFYTPDAGIATGSNLEQYNIGSNGEWLPASQSQLSQATADTSRRRDESLRPAQRRFADGYDHGHGGSSSATRKVMDFFRRRGRERET